MGWKWDGRERPPFAERPAAGQESVWDYPRPPRLEPDARRIVVRLGRRIIAETTSARRVLETASPPTIYVPPADVDMSAIQPAGGSSFCEWKGRARYWTVRAEEGVIESAAWSYPEPAPPFEAIRDHLAFYPGRIDCSVDGERVRPQGGGFYGGWVTDEIVGPWKGEPGTSAW